MPTISARIGNDLDTALDLASDDASVSKSELVRNAVAEYVETMDVSDDTAILAQRSLLIKRNRVAQLKGGFRVRVYDQVKKRFELGWTPRELGMVMESYHSEVNLLFDDSEAGEYHDWLVDLFRDFRQSYANSDYDSFPSFSEYGGVTDEEDIAEAVDDASELLQRHSPERVVSMLAERPSVTEEAAERAVDKLTKRTLKP